MRHFVIPETFFKLIAGKGKLYSRIWFYWLSECVDEMLEPEFIEKQKTELKKYKLSESEISEIYEYGVQLLQQDFRIIEEKKKKAVKPVSKEVQIIAEQVIEYLNVQTGATYESKKGSNLELIAGRIAEGFTIADFKLVIDKKVKDWKGTDWEKFLRPLTLFSKSKFENYLNSLNEQRSTSNFTKFASSVERAKQLIGIHTKL